MRRLASLLTVLAFAFSAPVALAQQQPGSPFGPLPQAPPAETPTPTPPPSVEAQQDTDRTLLFAIGGGLLVLFVVIGRVITRDARKTLREEGRSDAAAAARPGPAPARPPVEGQGAREDQGAAPRPAPEPLRPAGPDPAPLDTRGLTYADMGI